jgi:hypothetical protein
MSSSETDTQKSIDVVYVLQSYDDGIISIYDDKEVAMSARVTYADIGTYSWSDTFVTPIKINKGN